MAPIDFEKELRKKLRSRELKPSEQAWDRISDRIREKNPGSRRGPGLWMGLAAACAALLLGYFWFRDTPEVLLKDPVVGTPNQQVSNPPSEINPEAGLEVNTGQADTQVTGTALEQDGEITTPEMRQAVASQKEEVQWAQASETVEQPMDITGLIDKPVEQPEQEIAAVASPEMEEEQGVSDQELELLLQQAREQITSNSKRDTLSGVDPMQLLDRAEDELDLTFREQILEKLKTGINKVRTSVADRNNGGPK